jgi:hypothetical protein
MSLANPMALVHSKGKLDETYSSKDAHKEHVCQDPMEIDSTPIMESTIYSKFADNGNDVEYKDRVVGFYKVEGVSYYVNLVSRFSQKEGVDLVEVVSSVAKGF